MTSLGDFSPFGRFFEKGQNLDFYCYNHFGQQGKLEKIQFLEKLLKKLSRNVENFGCRQKCIPKGDGRAKKCGDRVAT